MSMTTPCTASPIEVPLTTHHSSDDEIRGRVRALLSAMHPENNQTERRRDTRYPFPYLVHLTPVAADGQTPLGESVVVAGKQLSERGLGFYHPVPLPHRRVVATLQIGNSRSCRFILDVTWCRFIKGGWYESGGRFLRIVEG